MSRKTRDARGANDHAVRRRHRFLAPLIVVVAGFAAYANSFSGVFLLDEDKEIVNNESIRSLSDPLHVLFSTQRPLVNLSLAVNYALGELRPAGYHLFNLTVHILAALVLLGLTRRIVQKVLGSAATEDWGNWVALSVPLLWVVHPLNTQAVTYVIQRAESMMALFYLLTLYSLWRGAEAEPKGSRWYGAAVLFCALGMACKPVMVTAPVGALLLDRAFLGGTFREALRRRWKVLLGLAATWVVLAGLGVLHTTFSAADREGAAAGFAFTGITPTEYTLTQLWAIVTYLRLSLIPYPQCFDYGWPVVRDPVTLILCGAIIAVLLGIAAAGLYRNRWWGFLGAMFFLVLSPTSSLIPIRDTIFEHRMYLPLTCVVGVVVVGAHELWSRVGMGRKEVLVGIAGAAVLVLTVLTVARNRLYHSETRMWEEVLGRRPDNPRAYDMMGALHDFAGRTDKAIELYRKALALKPDYVNARLNLGTAWITVGRVSEGIAEYRKVLEQDPRHPLVRLSLGEALLNTGDVAGLAIIREAVTLRPHDPSARFVLGNALMTVREFSAAEAAYRESLRLRPRSAEAQYGLGNALMQMNRLEEAVTAYRESLRIEPNRPSTWNNLGNVLARLQRWSQAEEALREAIRLNPGHVNARFALANVLRQTGRTAEAISEYRRVLQLHPGHAPARQALESMGQGSP